MHVRDVMTSDPLTVDPNTSLKEAARLLRQRGIRHLPVVDSAGHLTGILTDRDITHMAFVPLCPNTCRGIPCRPRLRG
jgi:acetoin utilization protein AcuB